MIERRSVPRYRVVLPTVSSGPRREEFYAVTDDVSVAGIRFKSATIPFVEEFLTCRIRHIGAVEAEVIRSEGEAFVVRILTKRPAADRIARGLLLHAQHQVGAREAVRAHLRIVPERADVTVTREDGSTLRGRLINVSASGAAIALPTLPDVGESIIVGRTPARVMRCFENGVGAIFARPFAERDVTSSMSL